MAIIQDIIRQVDDVKHNAFSTEMKLAWLAELDGKIATDVMLMSIEDAGQFRYAYPQDMTSETLVGFPHDDIYNLWLCAKIDFAHGEYDRYQNTMEMFNASFNNFVCWFASTYDPAQGYRKEEDYGNV